MSKGNNFGVKKSKKTWGQMNLSERKTANTQYGQWKRSEEGRQGGTYYGVKPPKGWTVKSNTPTKKASLKSEPTKAKKVTKTSANYAPPSNSSTTTTKAKTKGKVKPTGPGNYSTAGGVGKKSWSMLVDYQNKNGRGTKTQTFTRAPANMRELKAWWKGQQQSARTPSHKTGIFTRTQHPQSASAMKRIAKRTWPNANWDWIK